MSRTSSVLRAGIVFVRPASLYLLDEPEAALSPASQLKFLRVLQHLEAGGHAQFIMATHSPILLAYPGAFVPGRVYTSFQYPNAAAAYLAASLI